MEIKWAATCKAPRTWWGPTLNVILGPFVIMRIRAWKVKSMCQWLQLRVLSCLSKRRRNSHTRCFLGWNRRWARLWHLPNLHYMPLRNSSGSDENLKIKNQVCGIKLLHIIYRWRSTSIQLPWKTHNFIWFLKKYHASRRHKDVILCSLFPLG